MKNKLFFFDSNSSSGYSYHDLIIELNKTDYIPKYIYTENYFLIFKYVICSLIYDKPIIVLDYDFTEKEIINLDIKVEELDSSYKIDDKKEVTFESILQSTENLLNWDITLFTSGTIGLPKKIAHSFKNITRMVKISENKKQNIWGLAYNPTHIAGLQVFFQALRNNNSIINLFGQTRSKIFELINRFKITNISATPTFFRMLLPFEKEYPSIKRITSGGEKFDSKLSDNLLMIFPNARLLNVYASTEAGTIFAAKGDLFEIKEEYKNHVKIEDNELLIHRELLGKSISFEIKNDWYETGDIVEIVESSPIKFRFTSRKNDMVNVGGYKVNPNEVEQSINSHLLVISSRVYSKKNSVLGNILIADVKKKGELSEKELKLFLKDKLQSFKIPRIINFVESIELTRTGKIKRI